MVPILQNNYKFHKNALFANELISDGDEKIFYSFKPEYYKNYTYNLKEQNYLIHADIEEYMEPTGVATIHKDGLLKHYEKYFNNKNLRFEDVINTENKKSITLEELLLKYNFSFDIDLLCINTEKEDINILLNNNWELIQPQIIFFECEHNTYEETSRVIKLLENQGYKIKEITWLTKQMLAIKK